jgi:hypothetical protein
MGGRNKPLAMLAITALLAPLGTAFSGCGPDPASQVTLGLELSNLLNQVQSIMENAGEVGRGVIVTASGQVYTTIEAAQASFDAELNKSVDKLDAVATQKLDELKSIISQLQSDTDAKIRDASTRAQQLVLTLPFSNKAPQLTSYSPQFASTGGSAPVLLKLRGVFAYAQKQGYEPHLQIGSDTLNPVQSTTQDLAFQIPPGDFSSATSAAIGLTQASVTMPYEDGLLHKFRTATYKVLIGTLPQSPGKLVLTTVQHIPVADRQASSTRTFSQYSSNDDIDAVYCTDPAPNGWTIDPQSVAFVVTGPDNGHAQGSENDEWYKRVQRLDGQQVCFLIHTVHHRFGTSGKVDFHISYDLVRTRDTTQDIVEPLSLAWGDQVSRKVQANEWKLVYDGFAGHHEEIATSFHDNYLDVSISGDHVIVHALAAEDVRF